mmetsp:Transcript_46402/g.84951  ORF Transcript_46402/g.84951 Transcript_46402/m.84951 type:complete len:741 (-) Transcript_46402:59-2281(-)
MPLSGGHIITPRAALAMLMLSSWCQSVGALQPVFLSTREQTESFESILREPAPDIEQVGFPAVKAWTERRLKAAELSFKASGHNRLASPHDWADSLIYHIQMDRFNNGNSSNDKANLPSWQTTDMQKQDLTRLPIWRHGGDMQGIRDRLDYVEEMGFNTIWPTPLLKHDGAYHGYCATDPTTTDPNFGSPEELRALVADAHSRGMRFVLDIVVNHLCDRSTQYEAGSWDHDVCIANLNRTHWEGGESGSLKGQGKLNFSKDFFPPLRSQKFFNRCGLLPDEEMRCMSCPGTVFGDFDVGMYDYDTRNKELQELYTNFMKFWIAYADVDGVRLDAAKHVTEDFIGYFATEMRAYADKLGKTNFFMIGEVAAQKEWKAIRIGQMMSTKASAHGFPIPVTLKQRLPELMKVASRHTAFPYPGLNAVYNFEKSGRAGLWIRQARTSQDVADFYSSDEFKLLTDQLPQTHGDPFSADKELWTALELHDWARFLWTRPYRTDLGALGLYWLFMSSGTPVVYAGQEQGMNGNCPKNLTLGNATENIHTICTTAGVANTVLGRQDFFESGPWRLGSAIDSVNRQQYVGMPPAFNSSTDKVAWQKDRMIPRDHVLWRTTRRLVALRGSCRTLRHGSMIVHHSADERAGWISFSRIYGDMEAVMVLNPQESGPAKPGKVPINAHINPHSGAKFLNVFNTAEEATTQLDSNGHAFLDMGNKTLMQGFATMYVRADKLQPFNATLGVALCRS